MDERVSPEAQRPRTTLASLPPLQYASPRLKHYLEFLPFFLLHGCFQYLPEPAARALGHALADASRLVLRRRGAESLGRIRAVLGAAAGQTPAEKPEAVLRGSYRTFAENWVLLARSRDVGQKDLELKARLEGFDAVRQLGERGIGVIFATCHFGHWERASRLVDLAGFPAALMAGVQHNPLVDRVINRDRERGRNRVLHNRMGVRHAIALLRSGGRLVIVCDVDVGAHGVFVTFLGRPASTSRWPAELALRTGAWIVPAVTFMEDGGREVLRVAGTLDPGQYAADHESAVAAMTGEMNQLLSREIRAHPEQWFWMQRRWKTAPPGEKKPSP